MTYVLLAGILLCILIVLGVQLYEYLNNRGPYVREEDNEES
jgi:hypothetical protein